MNFPENIRCKNCSHFKRPYAFGNPDFDQVEAAKEFGECKLGDTDMGQSKSDALAYAIDSDQYGAWLKVSPEYGCIQFEEK